VHEMVSKVLITGGCGFVGTNLAQHFLRLGWTVRILESFARPSALRNRAWLERPAAERGPQIVEGDTRSPAAVLAAVEGVDAIVHLAGQVAVTSSIENPRLDFEINALGTLNVLEAARASPLRPTVLFSSTNKVYGGLEHLEIVERDGAHTLADLPEGVSETQPLDFHSPYGCSKGAADQYVRDYHRIYGVPTIVFRMSCIYGPHQYGTEDQGWLAHLARMALRGQPITIFGDGKQTRDVLYVDDLARAAEAALARRAKVAGEVFNIGGGPGNRLAVWTQYGPLLEGLVRRRLPVRYAPWRSGDQRVYVSNLEKARQLLAWEPTVGVAEGVRRMVSWQQRLLEGPTFPSAAPEATVRAESGGPVQGGSFR
jgi:CDP-paratose 2-epimerase